MSGGCEKFGDLLLDLAYGELDDERAAEVREHALACPACKAELESLLLTRKLAAGIPDEEPPAGWEAPVLDLAAAAAVSFAEQESGPADDRHFERDMGIAKREPGLIDRLRSLLLRPAIATAAAASVVFAVSFFLYKNAQTTDAAREGELTGAPFYGAAAVGSSEPSPEKEPALAAAEAPAEETDLDRATAPAPSPASPASRGAGVATGRKMSRPTAGGGGIGTAGPTPSNPADKLGYAQGEAERAAKKSAFAAPPRQASAPGAAPDASGATIDALEESVAEAASDDGWPSAGGGKARAKEAVADEPIGDDALSYKDGMAAYDRGDCKTARKSLQKVVDPPHSAPDLIPSSLHHLARCEKRSGRCGKAVLYYENLLSRYPSYADRAEAMWEAAACHRRLGHVERAADLLEDLAAIPGWHAKAVAESEDLGRQTEK